LLNLRRREWTLGLRSAASTALLTAAESTLRAIDRRRCRCGGGRRLVDRIAAFLWLERNEYFVPFFRRGLLSCRFFREVHDRRVNRRIRATLEEHLDRRGPVIFRREDQWGLPPLSLARVRVGALVEHCPDGVRITRLRREMQRRRTVRRHRVHIGAGFEKLSNYGRASSFSTDVERCVSVEVTQRFGVG